MASKSFQNVASVLGLCEGIAVQLEREYRKRERNKTVLQLCARLKAACQTAHNAWDGQLDAKDLRQIRERMTAVERASFLNGLAEPPTYCGFALGCLSDLFELVKDPYKLAALDGVNRALMTLNMYFDPRLSKHDQYVLARAAVDRWRETA